MWTAVKKLIGTGQGYFRIKAWDGIKREEISELRSFMIQQHTGGRWGVPQLLYRRVSNGHAGFRKIDKRKTLNPAVEKG